MRRAIGMMATVLGVAALLPAGPVSAAQLHTCRQGAQRLYTTDACPAGTRQIAVRSFVPDPDDRAERRAELARWRARAETPATAHARPQRRQGERRRPRDAAASPADRCHTARIERARARDREWLHITYARIQQLDAQVAQACD